MGDFDNLAAEMTRRERNMRVARGRSGSSAAVSAWLSHAESGRAYSVAEAQSFISGFDLARDTAPTAAAPINYARIAVLQTEREYVRRELARNGYYEREHTGSTPMSRRLDELDAAIREVTP